MPLERAMPNLMSVTLLARLTPRPGHPRALRLTPLHLHRRALPHILTQITADEARLRHIRLLDAPAHIQAAQAVPRRRRVATARAGAQAAAVVHHLSPEARRTALAASPAAGRVALAEAGQGLEAVLKVVAALVRKLLDRHYCLVILLKELICVTEYCQPCSVWGLGPL